MGTFDTHLGWLERGQLVSWAIVGERGDDIDSNPFIFLLVMSPALSGRVFDVPISCRKKEARGAPVSWPTDLIGQARSFYFEFRVSVGSVQLLLLYNNAFNLL